MNRILVGTALAVVLVGSSVAYAANSTPAKTTPVAATSSTPAATPAPAVDNAALCTSLADQYKTAEAANATNAKLGAAKAKAAKAEKECKSTKASDLKKGVADYKAALKLLGVTPS
jgi:hypothetical protein